MSGSAQHFRRGVLIKCDEPTREFILHLNDQHGFLIERLDDQNLVIDSGFVDHVREAVTAAFEKHVFEAGAEAK